MLIITMGDVCTLIGILCLVAVFLFAKLADKQSSEQKDSTDTTEEDEK